MDTSRVVEGVSALAQDTRLDIVRFLVRRGAEGAPAGRIAEQFGLPSATLTFHLNTLTVAGLLNRQRNGRQIIYRADIGALHGLTAFLLKDCCSESDAVDTETNGRHAAA